MSRIKYLWRYRYFLSMITYQSIRTKYANSVLGLLWAVINPLFTTLVFTLVFTVLSPRGGEKAYPAFFMAGLLSWNYFAHSVTVSSSSVLRYNSLVRKANFPLEMLPLAGVLSQIPDLMGGIVVYFLLAAIFGVSITAWPLLLPALLLFESLFALSVGMLFASFNVFYRDFNDIMQVLLSAWFFATPIIYSGTTVPDEYMIRSVNVNLRALWFILNPMASLVVGYRDVLYRGQPLAIGPTLSSATVIVIFFIISYTVYRRRSERFAEAV